MESSHPPNHQQSEQNTKLYKGVLFQNVLVMLNLRHIVH